jgi:hypothetical protein
MSFFMGSEWRTILCWRCTCSSVRLDCHLCLWSCRSLNGHLCFLAVSDTQVSYNLHCAMQHTCCNIFIYDNCLHHSSLSDVTVDNRACVDTASCVRNYSYRNTLMSGQPCGAHSYTARGHIHKFECCLLFCVMCVMYCTVLYLLYCIVLYCT